MGASFSDIGGDIGGIVGSLFGGGDRDEAMRYLDKARGTYEDLNPNITAEQAGPSNYLAADPETRAAQMDALGQLQGKYRQGGLDAIDRSRLNDITTETNRNAAVQRSAVMEDAARRGLNTSGNALVSAQLAGQNAANQGANQGIQTAALAENARMGAIRGAAGVAGGIRSQDYQKAAAQDAIERFNTTNRQNAQQQTFDNSYRRAGGIAQQYDNQAGQKNGDANYTIARDAGIGKAIGTGADAAGQAIAGGAGGAGGFDPTMEPGAQAGMTGGSDYF